MDCGAGKYWGVSGATSATACVVCGADRHGDWGAYKSPQTDTEIGARTNDDTWKHIYTVHLEIHGNTMSKFLFVRLRKAIPEIGRARHKVS